MLTICEGIPNHILDALFNWKLQKTYKSLTKKFHLAVQPAGTKNFLPCSVEDGGLSNLVLPSEFNRQRVVIGTCAETIDQNVIQRFHVWQFTQERDHV